MAWRRVIELLSLLRRFALALGTAFALTQAARASAQIPVFAPAEPQAPPSELPSPPAAEPALSPATPGPADSAPAPAAPPSIAPPAVAPTPAKTDHLAPPGARPAPPDDDVVDVVARPRRHWYGWQTLTTDGASMLLLFAGAGATAQNDTADTMVTMGLIGYEFAPGIIHFVHGNPGRGFASFGMRLGMPIAGAFLGAATASGCDGFQCEASGAALGLFLGMGGAMAIDAAVFAYDDPERTADQAGARLVPLVALAPRAAWLGLGGRL